MRRTHRLIAAGFAASLALSAPTASLAAPAQADADLAAQYLVAQADDEGVATPGQRADLVIALAAAGGQDSRVTAEATLLAESSDEYVTDNAAAAKTLIALDAGCVDHAHLHDKLLAGMAEDGSVGSFPSAFGQSLVIIGLHRSGQDIPQVVVDRLKAWQTGADGSFEYEDFATGEPTFDADGTALAAMALDAAGDEAASDRALSALEARQTEQGYWENYSPVNTTGLVADALADDGRDVAEAQGWLAGQQQADGGFPSALGSTDSDVMATTQAMFGVTGNGYTDAAVDCGGDGPIIDTGYAPADNTPLAALAFGGLLTAAGAATVVVAGRR
ncbi:hypothetical protein [Kytococcus sedentarius]|uniref:hypothetical protein n=1 Tax=Kytococcus sedentarius TaxID=1276 RepID=UPI0035BC4CCB